ncbi:AraC family transcriptional regulator [Streptomyces sp. NPDC093544]|uniref:AraC family transcriptional regulator n=1 Tax=Streptomyces sp. NPDC093544 TaxID=3155200 RepID=UPI003437BCCB
MDVLSDVLATLRTGEPQSARFAYSAPWEMRCSGGFGAAFQVVLQGSFWVIPPDRQPFPVAAGDVLFLPRGTRHRQADHPLTPLADRACPPLPGRPVVRPTRIPASAGGRQSPDTVLIGGGYRLGPERTHPFLSDLPDFVHLPAGLGGRPAIRAAVDLLAAELDRPSGQGANAAVTPLLDVLLLYILRACCEEQPAPVASAATSGWAAALRDPAVSAALHAIHRDPSAPWTVAALGAEAGTSRAVFARRFTALVGRSPLAYLTWWRMTTAARLLRSADTPLGTVARQVGYASEYGFATAFKRLYGSSPGRYRRQSGVA